MQTTRTCPCDPPMQLPRQPRSIRPINTVDDVFPLCAFIDGRSPRVAWSANYKVHRRCSCAPPPSGRILDIGPPNESIFLKTKKIAKRLLHRIPEARTVQHRRAEVALARGLRESSSGDSSGSDRWRVTCSQCSAMTRTPWWTSVVRRCLLPAAAAADAVARIDNRVHLFGRRAVSQRVSLHRRRNARFRLRLYAGPPTQRKSVGSKTRLMPAVRSAESGKARSKKADRTHVFFFLCRVSDRWDVALHACTDAWKRERMRGRRWQ